MVMTVDVLTHLHVLALVSLLLASILVSGVDVDVEWSLLTWGLACGADIVSMIA